MKSMKSIYLVIFSALLVLAGCGSTESQAPQENENTGNEEEVVKIGVTQIVEHPSLDAAFEGFKQALADHGLDNVEYDVQNAQGDMNNNSSIAGNLVGNNVDLIFANSTPSAQGALSKTDEIPIVFTSVTDPIVAQLVDSLEEPGGNVTGTSDSNPDAIPMTLDFIKNDLGLTKVGLIYNAGEQNSVAQVDRVNEIIEEKGMESVEASVSTSAEVKQAAEALVGRAEVFFIVSDNTVVSAIESVVGVANEADMPLLVSEFDSLNRGGFAAYGFEYYDIGYEAGLKAVDILVNGTSPAVIPVEYPQNVKLLINKNAGIEQGVEIDPAWDDKAEYIEN